MQKVKKIDIHVHCRWSQFKKVLKFEDDYADETELRAMYDRLGIECGVLLPEVHNECARDVESNAEAAYLAALHPETFIWFCNVTPRMISNSPASDFTPLLEHYKSLGAQGVGELCCNYYFDDPLMWNLFSHCEACGLPVTFHAATGLGGTYGLADDLHLPRLEKTLKRFPSLVFLAHSQTFWAEMSGDLTDAERDGYPRGKVAPGGRVEALMREYPNLRGDLSAGSGYNALARDPEHAYRFLEEFSDRLYFGTDICNPKNDMKLSKWLDDALDAGNISPETYYKVCRGNAEKLLKV